MLLSCYFSKLICLVWKKEKGLSWRGGNHSQGKICSTHRKIFYLFFPLYLAAGMKKTTSRREGVKFYFKRKKRGDPLVPLLPPPISSPSQHRHRAWNGNAVCTWNGTLASCSTSECSFKLLQLKFFFFFLFPVIFPYIQKLYETNKEKLSSLIKVINTLKFLPATCFNIWSLLAELSS